MSQQDFRRLAVRDCRFVRENTMRPPAPGDVVLGCTFLNDLTDDHAGLGRILQYDRDLKLEGVLWTEGHRGAASRGLPSTPAEGGGAAQKGGEIER